MPIREDRVVAYRDLPDPPPVMRRGPRTMRWHLFFEACVMCPGEWLRASWPMGNGGSARAYCSIINHNEYKKVTSSLRDFGKLGTFEARWAWHEGTFGVEQPYVYVKFTPYEKPKTKRRPKK